MEKKKYIYIYMNVCVCTKGIIDRQTEAELKKETHIYYIRNKERERSTDRNTGS